MSMAMADYDRDGFLDLYLCVYAFYYGAGEGKAGTPMPYYDARNGPPSVLFRNDGTGRFTDVTQEAGLEASNDRYHFAAAWGDYDGDGWPDLSAANEFGGNVLYHNRRDGTFTERATVAGVTDGGAGMGLTWGDYDGDGALDLYVSNMHANSAWALFHPDFPSPIPWRYRMLGLVFPRRVTERSEEYIDRLSRGSTLYRNQGDGTFTDVSDAAGVRDAQWGWAVAFLDYDNDGRLDIYAANGFISGPLLDDV